MLRSRLAQTLVCVVQYSSRRRWDSGHAPAHSRPDPRRHDPSTCVVPTVSSAFVNLGSFSLGSHTPLLRHDARRSKAMAALRRTCPVNRANRHLQWPWKICSPQETPASFMHAECMELSDRDLFEEWADGLCASDCMHSIKPTEKKPVVSDGADVHLHCDCDSASVLLGSKERAQPTLHAPLVSASVGPRVSGASGTFVFSLPSFRPGAHIHTPSASPMTRGGPVCPVVPTPWLALR